MRVIAPPIAMKPIRSNQPSPAAGVSATGALVAGSFFSVEATGCGSTRGVEATNR